MMCISFLILFVDLQATQDTYDTGDKSFPCHLCGKYFISNSDYKIHLRRCIGEKPYQYNIFTKELTSNLDLAIHLRTHTGEKP